MQVKEAIRHGKKTQTNLTKFCNFLGARNSASFGLKQPRCVHRLQPEPTLFELGLPPLQQNST